MIPVECPHEREVLEAVMTNGHAEGAGSRFQLSAELRAHVASCPTCQDVVVVAGVMREERDLFRSEDMPVPAAGQVWWRAAVRARLEATQAAARPITWAQGLAGACAAGITAGALGAAWPTVAASMSWLGARVAGMNPAAVSVADVVSTAVQRSLPLAVALAGALVLAPLALYLALSDD